MLLIPESAGIYLESHRQKEESRAVLESMKAGIMNRLNSIKSAEAYDRYVEQLRKQSSIKRY